MSGAAGDKVRVVILADTHGVLDERVANVAEQCDVAVHAGDVGADAVLAALEACTSRVVAVRGNNDVAAKWQGDSATPQSLPEQAGCDLPGGRVEVVHGHQHTRAKTRHAWMRRRFPHARTVVYGHSHRLVCDRDEQPWVLNPGAAGRSRTYGGPSCLVLTAARSRWTLREHRFSR